MKKSFVLFSIFIVSINLFAQRWEMRENQRKRLEELKKIKLIETLDLNEDESVKFFALYNAHQKKVQSIQREREKIMDQLERLTQNESKFNLKIFEDFEKRLNELDQELFRNRQEFHSSLKNVLTPFKIAKFYVFERRFIKEVNRLIMMRRYKENQEE